MSMLIIASDTLAFGVTGNKEPQSISDGVSKGKLAGIIEQSASVPAPPQLLLQQRWLASYGGTALCSRRRQMPFPESGLQGHPIRVRGGYSIWGMSGIKVVYNLSQPT